MKYTLNEYYPYCGKPITSVVICPNNDVETKLRAYLKQNHATIVPLYELVDEHSDKFPMPKDMMNSIDSLNDNSLIVFTGIDAYISLLDDENAYSFAVSIFKHIEKQNLHAIFIIHDSSMFKSLFTNPKYEGSMQYITLSGNIDAAVQPSISVIPQKWILDSENNYTFKKMLKDITESNSAEDYIVITNNITTRQAGLGNNVLFKCDIKSYVEERYGFDANLPSETIESLLDVCRGDNSTPEIALTKLFNEMFLNEKLAVKRLYELQNDKFWNAYCWLVKKKISPGSYLFSVLCAEPASNDFIHAYVVDEAIKSLNGKDVITYSLERASAIKMLPISVESLIINFIELSHNSTQALYYLNCGTQAEYAEIVRRASSWDLITGIPCTYEGLFPALTNYLSSDYDYKNPVLKSYFSEYRKLKVKNKISDDFVKKAMTEIPQGIKSRDALLAELSANPDTALLVVDGMGAEYLPLLISTAKRMGIGVLQTEVVSARLPSSTEYNMINWPKDRKLAEIKNIDNIAHGGETKNEKHLYYENIAETLQKIETKVFNRIVQAFATFSKVVVTADHGTSRLAVLAHENGLDKTLTQIKTPLDWRYTEEVSGDDCPPEILPYYRADKSKTYWVVRGYNRLPKSGGKLYELHGGAALEEALVPLVIFSNSKEQTEYNNSEKPKIEQFVEREGFDI